MDPDQPTADVCLDAGEEWVETGFELLVREPGCEPVRWPLRCEQVSLGARCDRAGDLAVTGAAEKQAMLTCREGRVFLTSRSEDPPTLVNGREVRFTELQDGDELGVGRVRLRLERLAAHLAELQGYGALTGQRWRLGQEPTTLGRPGRRPNTVELGDPTVSRRHATLEVEEGVFYLVNETDGARTLVNGEPVSGRHPLADGDLLQLGQVLLRFRVAVGTVHSQPTISTDATILFACLRDFASRVEIGPLDEVVRQACEFYRRVGKVVVQHHGEVHRFLGDCVMALFETDPSREGAPERAVAAALEIQSVLAEVNRAWEETGVGAVQAGIGINTGQVALGEVGFTGHHEVAILGDGANVAARLQAEACRRNEAILIGGSTAARVQGRFEVKPLGSATVKGRSQPVEIFSVLGPA